MVVVWTCDASLGHGSLNSLVKACPVLAGVALSIGLGVNNCVFARRVLLESHFEAASGACILVENVIDPSRVLRVESLLDLGGVFEVASASAVLHIDGVLCVCRTVAFGCSF